jgi:hypothetical protein
MGLINFVVVNSIGVDGSFGNQNSKNSLLSKVAQTITHFLYYFYPYKSSSPTRKIFIRLVPPDSPVIMQGSAGARSYAGEPFLRHLIIAATEMYPHIPVVMHQDHGSEPAICLRSIQSGFSSVMMDGSLEADMKTPASFEYNVDVTAEVVKMAHAGGVSVEGELGCLGSHYHRNMRIHFSRCNDKMTQEWLTRIRACTCRALHNNGAIGFVCSLHNRMHLLHIVNIECWHTIIVFCRVV